MDWDAIGTNGDTCLVEIICTQHFDEFLSWNNSS